MRGILLILMLVMTAAPALAEGRLRLGAARVFNNDFLGDGHDRWRTGSYAVSIIRGPQWQEHLPEDAGQLLEYRVRSEIIAPANLANPVLGGDRPYVGALSFGLFTHFQKGTLQITAGIDLVATGPQTGLGRFQSWAHRLTGDTIPAVLGSQIANGIHPTISVEIAKDIPLGAASNSRIVVRPFLEGQVGIESFIRIGGDITIGNLGRGDLRVRDAVTGQRIVGVRAKRAGGLSFVAGVDAAFVASSVYLPASAGYNVSSPRLRARAGFSYEQDRSSIFYGVTWLGKEFAAQPTSQIVGTLALKLRF